MMRLFGLSPLVTEIDALIAVADDSGDGELEFLEFVNLLGSDLKPARKPNPMLVLEQLRLQIREFREVFEIFDPDDSGEIGADEILDAMRLFGVHASEDEVHAIIAEVDIDGNGQLGFTEFVLMTVKAEASASHNVMTFKVSELKAAFKGFSEDRSGSISMGQLSAVLETLGMANSKEAAVEMATLCDSDGDGEINFREFCTMVTAKLANDEASDDFDAADRSWHPENCRKIREMVQKRMAGSSDAPSDEDLYNFLIGKDVAAPGLICTSLEFIKQLPEQSGHELTSKLRVVELKPGSVISKQGDEARELFIVLEGTVDYWCRPVVIEDVEVAKSKSVSTSETDTTKRKRREKEVNEQECLRSDDRTKKDESAEERQEWLPSPTNWLETKALCIDVMAFLSTVRTRDTELRLKVQE